MYMILSTYGTFPNTNHIMVCKTSPNKFKRVKRVKAVFPDYNGMVRNQ